MCLEENLQHSISISFLLICFHDFDSNTLTGVFDMASLRMKTWPSPRAHQAPTKVAHDLQTLCLPGATPPRFNACKRIRLIVRRNITLQLAASSRLFSQESPSGFSAWRDGYSTSAVIVQGTDRVDKALSTAWASAPRTIDALAKHRQRLVASCTLFEGAAACGCVAFGFSTSAQCEGHAHSRICTATSIRILVGKPYLWVQCRALM